MKPSSQEVWPVGPDESNIPANESSRRLFLKRVGLASAWYATPAGIALLHEAGMAQSAQQSELERMAAGLNFLARHTMAGVAAFAVPGNDLYSLGQGVTTFMAPGGVGAKADAFLVYMFDNFLPLPGASRLATGLGQPFRAISLPVADGTALNLGTAVTTVLASADSVPLSLLLTLLLNALAIYVKPSSAVGILPSPFARLSWRDKARVFELIEGPGDEATRIAADAIKEPVTRTLIGYLQLAALGLLAFAGQGSYSEWGVLDSATRSLRATPVGWKLSQYGGVADGRNDFKGYYQDRRSASDA